MIPLDEARQHVLDRTPTLKATTVPLHEALGLALAKAVSSAEDTPAFDNTAVDGYAVRAEDTAAAPLELAVVGLLPAGMAPDRPVGKGEAIRIMTGAPMPEGADAVVMVEDTEALAPDRVRLKVGVEEGDGIRRRGSDVHAGDVLLAAGTELGPAQLGLLASVGVRHVAVHARPRVGVLSTGDELVDDDRPLRVGEVRESNRIQLLAQVEQAGCTPVDLGVVRDDEALITEVLTRAALECDALVSSGGVSMGDFDLIKVVLDRIGEMRWMQIAIKPAKPFAFGVVGTTPVFGLPGNPVSSLVSFELLARPALRQLMGHPQLDRPRLVAVADEGFRRRADGKTHFVRVRATFGDDGRLHVRSSGEQGSHQLAATAAANGLAVVPDGEGVAAGAGVETLLLA